MPNSDVSNAQTLTEYDRDLPPALPVGQIIGAKYVIKRVLGIGGNGAVYEGEHTSVGHRVAIKVVHRDLADREETMERFQREARICGVLRHPHVGQVYDVGTLDDGSPYMVMELQEGRSLADVLSDGALPIIACLDITRQVLAALEAVHNAGVIHRDVKPDNVMIVRDRTGDVLVKLVDFGISKAFDKRPSDGRVTRDEVIVGTPDYMAPEQLRGGEIDPRTDIYGVGVMLYEVLTGRLPFESESLTDLMVSIMRDPVTPPSALRADCPSPVECIVLKAMSRKPAQRYQSAEQMSRALAEARASARNLPSTSLTRLSERPLGPARKTRTHMRRTIDTHTLDGILPEPELPKRSLALPLGIAAAACAGVGLLVWALVPSQPPDLVVVTPLPAQPSAALPQVVSSPVDVHPVETAIEPPATLAQPIAEVARGKPAANSIVEVSNQPRVPSTSRRQHDAAPSPHPQSSGRPASTGEATPAPAVPDVQPLLKQAASAFATGQFERARGLYREIAANNPSQADAWRGLCLAAARVGQRAEAERALHRYLELRPNAPDAARISEQLGRVP